MQHLQRNQRSHNSKATRMTTIHKKHKERKKGIMINTLSIISSTISRIFYRRCQKRRLKHCMRKRMPRKILEQTMPRHGFRKGLRAMTFNKTKKTEEVSNQPRKVRPDYHHYRNIEE